MPDETAPQPRIKIAWLAGTLAAFALFAVIGAYSVRMTQDYPGYDQQRAAQRYDTLAKLRHDEQALLSPVDTQGRPAAEWVDQAKGVVRLPIEEAMAMEIDTLKAQPAAMGAEIPPPPAPAKAAPAAGATNAAPVAPASAAGLPTAGAAATGKTAPGAGSAPAKPAALLPSAGATNAAPAAATPPSEEPNP